MPGLNAMEAPVYKMSISQLNNLIPGGYYIKARAIEKSEIAHTAPVVREVWDWLLRQVNHKDNTQIGIRRGQCMRRLSDIQEGLHWFIGYRKMTYSKSQCEGACEWLRERSMITTAKTTRGMIITICNYDRYANPENYEANNENSTKPTRRQQQADTINKNDKNDKNDIVANAKPKLPSFKNFSDDQFIENIRINSEGYPKNLLNDFYKYWSEKGASGKMKFQMEKTWETEKRLSNWQRNEEKWAK